MFFFFSFNLVYRFPLTALAYGSRFFSILIQIKRVSPVKLCSRKDLTVFLPKLSTPVNQTTSYSLQSSVFEVASEVIVESDP